MNEWALMKNGRIVNCVTTSLSKPEVEARHPGYEVADIYNLPSNVQQEYQYWSERP